MDTLSVVISAWNEEKKIERTLASIVWADEIIVIDNESTDKTKGIAKKYHAKVYSQPNNLMLNINKNFGINKASRDWILYLDADEEIPDALRQEVKRVLAGTFSSMCEGYWISRKNMIFGKWVTHGLWWPDKQIRLFRKGKGIFPCEHIHEYIKVDGTVGELTEPYIHYNYESVHQYLTKIDRASTSEATHLREMSYQLMWYDAIRFPVSDFLKIYFAEKAYKDGLHGLVLALFQAFYSFCTFGKVWEMKGFEMRDVSPHAVIDELNTRGREAKYWMLTVSMDEARNRLTKFLKKIERKLLQRHA